MVQTLEFELGIKSIGKREYNAANLESIVLVVAASSTMSCFFNSFKRINNSWNKYFHWLSPIDRLCYLGTLYFVLLSLNYLLSYPQTVL